jgi:hypothetical protein
VFVFLTKSKRCHGRYLAKYISGLYYKPMTIVNDNSRIINKLEASLTDKARVIIYDRHMFIVQATGVNCYFMSVEVDLIKFYWRKFTQSFL